MHPSIDLAINSNGTFVLHSHSTGVDFHVTGVKDAVRYREGRGSFAGATVSDSRENGVEDRGENAEHRDIPNQPIC